MVRVHTSCRFLSSCVLKVRLGELIASAGDGAFNITATFGILAYNSAMLADGMIMIWAPSSTPPPVTYGSDLSAEDLQYEKEYWKPRTTFRSVFDLSAGTSL